MVGRGKRCAAREHFDYRSFFALWNTLPELIITLERYKSSLLCEFTWVSENAVATSHRLSSPLVFREQQILHPANPITDAPQRPQYDVWKFKVR